MDPAGSAGGLGRSFRPSEVTNFARLHELRHGAHGIFDGCFSIDAVLIVEVDHLDAEPLQRRIARAANVLGPAVDAEKLTVFGPHVAKFGGQENPRPAGAYRTAAEPLVREGAVDVCGVQELDSDIDRPVNGGNGSRL